MNAPRFKSGRKAKMFSALEMVKGELTPAPILEGGVVDANWPVVTAPMVLVAPVETKLTANELAAERSSSANLIRNRICLSAGGSATWRLLTTVFANGAASAAGPVANVFVRYPAGEGKRIARGLNVDILRGNVSLSSLRSGSKFCSTVML